MSWYPVYFATGRCKHNTGIAHSHLLIHKKTYPRRQTDLWQWIPCQRFSWHGRVGVTGYTEATAPTALCQMALTVKSSHLLTSRKKHTETWRERVLKYIRLFRLPASANSAGTPSSSPFHTIFVKCSCLPLLTFYFCPAFTWKGGNLFMLLENEKTYLAFFSFTRWWERPRNNLKFQLITNPIFRLTHFQKFWQEKKRTG